MKGGWYTIVGAERVKFQRSDDSWIVWVRKKDFAPAAGRSNCPSEIAIGTINERTGALDPWPVAYGAPMLASQSRSRPNEELWKKMALQKLQQVARSPSFQMARRDYEMEEQRTGDVIVRLSSGRQTAFHDSKRAHDWAEAELRKMGPGARAEMFRRPIAGATPRTGAPWTEPYSALEVNEHGVIHMASLRSPEARHGNFASSRPWIVYGRAAGVLHFISRFSNEVRAREMARDEHAYVKHIAEIDSSARRQLGLRG
jgi:hypothetical protein